MTGGTVVVLGSVGRNLAAGMTGGELFVLETDERLARRLNPELVEVERPDAAALERFWHLLELHREQTGSSRAASMVSDRVGTSAVVRRIVPRADLAAIVGAQEGTKWSGGEERRREDRTGPRPMPMPTEVLPAPSTPSEPTPVRSLRR